MPLTLLRGQFRIVGTSPDGDSIRFYPADPGIWARARIEVRANAHGGVQLRLDAVDALETHYTPRSSPHTWRQNPQVGNGAAAALLELLGFGDVVRDEQETVTAATPSARPGAILTRFADKYGRAVAMVFADGQQPAGDDGAPVFLDAVGLRTSVNSRLLEAGWAYPTFYSRLYHDLRDALAEGARTSRDAGRGVWAADSTNAGFELRSREQLTTELVLLPKLFRRLADYLALDNTGGVDLGGFVAFLAAWPDRLFTVPDGQSTNLDTFVEVHGQHLRLTRPPERLVFLEK
ncbi:thermonuclease family protein [Geodermatophilus poikilotrophus]|uniref:Endonuclease YncB, thermonuclease family n=1 Tax=Geodermatophilus poikilotrophus TaxID=1333667 RepID=A0A1H9Z1A2_9ACTN|nr:thermonuclease family protein [Geodermatophilus poikilotrophus]SES75302.1 Endonuclease YncB, thermonuclease family [Geodermatophilus poikilotrophus]